MSASWQAPVPVHAPPQAPTTLPTGAVAVSCTARPRGRLVEQVALPCPAASVQAGCMRVLPGTVVDGSGQAFGLTDPSFVAVNTYPKHPIDAGFALTTLLPQPAALAKLAGSRWAKAWSTH